MALRDRGIWLAILALACLAAACAKPSPEPDLLAPTDEQLKIRALQSRAFDVADRSQAIRGVMEALQDLGFIIERANEPMGLVTAARFGEPRYVDVVAVTVTIRPEGEGKMLIRANAMYNNEPVTEAKVYQNFFATLERSMFIGRQ